MRAARSLQSRFLAVVMAAAAACAALAAALGYRLEHDAALAEGARAVESLIDAVQDSASIGAYARDRVLLQEIADGLLRHPLVRGVAVVAVDGDVLVARGAPARWRSGPGSRGLVPMPMPMQPHATGTNGAKGANGTNGASGADGTTGAIGTTTATGTTGPHAGTMDWAAWEPALVTERLLVSPFDRAEVLGRLQVTTDRGRLEAQARAEALRLVLMIVAQTSVVALVLAMAATLLVSRPIVRLARQLRAAPPGAEPTLVTPPHHRSDEIGRLIEAANALLAANRDALALERRLRREIEAMEAQYRQIFDASSAGIFVLDGDGRLINGNPTVLRIVGMTLDAARALAGDAFVHVAFARPERVREMIEAAARGRSTVSADLELRADAAATRWVHCLISVQPSVPSPAQADGRTTAGAQSPALAGPLVEGVIYDITERKLAEREARHRADHDPLTGLKSRAAVDAALDRLANEARAGDGALAVLYIDLDGFKAVNDRLGHKAGDQVLQAVAARMQGVVRRATDLIGRVGGDEFVIALPHVASGDLLLGEIGMALVAALCAPIELADGPRVRIGASIGIGCSPRHGTTRRALLHAADAAMYEVKRSGKNAVAMAIEAPVIGLDHAV